MALCARSICETSTRRLTIQTRALGHIPPCVATLPPTSLQISSVESLPDSLNRAKGQRKRPSPLVPRVLPVALEDFLHPDHTLSHNLHGKARHHLVRRTPDKPSHLWPLFRRRMRCRCTQAAHILPMWVHTPAVTRSITARHMATCCIRSRPRRQTTLTAHTISLQEVTRRIQPATPHLVVMALRYSCLAAQARRRILLTLIRNKEDRIQTGHFCHPSRRATLDQEMPRLTAVQPQATRWLPPCRSHTMT